MKRPEFVAGRGGRIVVVDESKAAAFNAAVNAVPHRRDVGATQPVDQLGTPSLNVVERADERVEAWWERFFDGLSFWGLVVGAGVGAVCLLLLFVAGANR